MVGKNTRSEMIHVLKIGQIRRNPTYVGRMKLWHLQENE